MNDTNSCHMYVRPKVLLLDVDGVVFRNSKALNKVSTNIVKYVATELRVDPPAAANINKMLYKNFGHSYIGLKAVYDMVHDLDHFTRYVYTYDILSTVSCSYTDETVIEDSRTFREVAEVCRRKDIDLFLFSNAPSSWCKKVVETMRLSDVISAENILSCDHPVFDGHLKPNPLLYKNVYNYLRFKKYDDVECMFIDDSMCNLVPLIGSPEWRPILFERGVDGASRIHSKKFRQISELSDMIKDLV
jgi:FMN phosphatase YigB (HAD superfamily)